MHLLGDTFRLQNLGSFSHLVLYMLSPYWCQGSQGKREAASPSLPFLLQLFPPGPPVCCHCDNGHDPKQLREERLISLLTGQAVVKEDQAGAQGRAPDAETSRVCCLLADTPGLPAQGQPTHNGLGPPMSSINAENTPHANLMKAFSQPVGHFLG